MIVHVLALFALSQRWVKHDLSAQHVVFTGRDRVIEVNATWQISTPSPTPLNTPLDPPVVVLPQEAVIERQHFVISPTDSEDTELDIDIPTQPRELSRAAVDPSPMPEPAATAPPVPPPSRAASVPQSAAATSTAVMAESAGNDADEPPSFASNRPPKYPETAVRRRWQGTVLLRVHITVEGVVADVQVAKSSGYPVLDAEAVQTVKQWHAKPALRHGRPTATTELLPIRFELEAAQSSSED